MSPTFGLIAEGLTDQIVLKNILFGYFKDPDLIVKNLQPIDSTDEDDDARKFGGWYKVLKYCQDGDLLSDLVFTDFLIIQIDSDIAHLTPLDVPQNPKETIIERVKDRLILAVKKQLSDEVFEKYGQRIIFAIAVNEIECWLLPLHYDDKKQSARENNCVHHLNSKLSRNNENTINPNDKQSRIYKNISNDFRKAKVFKKIYPQNPSLKIFVEELISRVPIIDTSIND